MKTLNSWEEAKALIVEQRKQEGAIAKELCEQYPKLGYSRALEIAERSTREGSGDGPDFGLPCKGCGKPAVTHDSAGDRLCAECASACEMVLCPIDNVVIEFDRGIPMNAKVCYFCGDLVCDLCTVHVSGPLYLCKPCYEDVQRQRNGEFPL